MNSIHKKSKTHLYQFALAALAIAAVLTGGCSLFFGSPLLTVNGSEVISTIRTLGSDGKFMQGGSFGSSGSLDMSRAPLTFEFRMADDWAISQIYVDGVSQTSFSPGSNSFVLTQDMLLGAGSEHFMFVLAIPVLEGSAERRVPLGESYLALQVSGDGVNHIRAYDMLSENNQTPPINLYSDTRTITSFSGTQAGRLLYLAVDDPGDFASPHKVLIVTDGASTATIDNAFEPSIAGSKLLFRDDTGRLYNSNSDGSGVEEILEANNTKYYLPTDRNPDSYDEDGVFAIYREEIGGGLYAEYYSFTIEYENATATMLPVLLKSRRIGDSGDIPLPIVWDPTSNYAVFAVKSAATGRYSIMSIVPHAFTSDYAWNGWWGNFIHEPSGQGGTDPSFGAIDSAMQNWTPYSASGLYSQTLSDERPYPWFPATTAKRH